MLEISRDAYLQMKYLTEECNSEIYGWLIGEIDKNDARVEKIIVNEQTASSGDCELDTEALEKFILEHDDNENVIGWWHSHNSMSAFWSSTDDENIETLMHSLNRVISIVSSVQGGFNIKAREDVWTTEEQFELDDLKYTIETEEQEDIKERCKEIIDDKVNSKTYSSMSNKKTKWLGRDKSKNDCWWMGSGSKYPAFQDEEERTDDYYSGYYDSKRHDSYEENVSLDEQIESDDWIWSEMRQNFVHIDEISELYSMPLRERESLEKTKTPIDYELEYLDEEQERKLKEHLQKLGGDD